MRTSFLLPVLLAVALGCKGPATDPRAAIQVSVSSTPAGGEVFLGGKPLGATPRTLTVPSMEALLDLTATSGREEPVEKRVRFLAQDRAEVVFVFGAGKSDMAKALGLTRILVFDYGAGVTFELNRSDLKSDFLPLLERQAALLRTRFPSLDVYVCGHTDSLGTQDFNLSLSLARARSVAADLEARGVPRARLKTQGFGSAYPVAPNQTETGRALNRRTELVLPQ
jgi:outer membrane protein OmpA-like peptidoglycan-associated protein